MDSPQGALRRTATSVWLGLVLATLVQAAVPAHADPAPDFAKVVQQYDDAVVNITISGVNPLAKPKDQSVHGEGSGFIIASNGLILTNAHVVRDARHIIVRLKDHREFAAHVVGLDARTDVAVLTIDAQGLPTVRIGHDAGLQVGQWVLAIGSPYGFEHSVSAGVVSAKRRLLPGATPIPMIQTDVPVNPGNSGGPLFNGQGDVVGINAALYSDTGGYQGLSFALPIDLAMHIKDEILTQGHVAHAELGVMTQNMNLALARSFALDQPRGVLILSVDPQGPAAQAGLRVGDIVLTANGQTVRSQNDLPMQVMSAQPGDLMRLTLWRDGREQTALVQLGDADADDAARAASKMAAALEPGSHQASLSGGDDTPLGLELRERTAHDKARTGEIIVQAAHGASLEAGITRGDVILAINGDAVKDLAQARHELAAAGPYVALLIQRKGERAFVPVTRQ